MSGTNVLFVFFFIAMVIGGLVGYGAERLNIVDRSFFAAVVIGVMGSLVGFMILTISNIGISYRVVASVIGAVLALWVLPGRGK